MSLMENSEVVRVTKHSSDKEMFGLPNNAIFPAATPVACHVAFPYSTPPTAALSVTDGSPNSVVPYFEASVAAHISPEASHHHRGHSVATANQSCHRRLAASLDPPSVSGLDIVDLRRKSYPARASGGGQHLLRQLRTASVAPQLATTAACCLDGVHRTNCYGEPGAPPLARLETPGASWVPAPTPGRPKSSWTSRADTGNLPIHSEPPPWIDDWHPVPRVSHPMAVEAAEQLAVAVGEAVYNLAPELNCRVPQPKFVRCLLDTIDLHILRRFEMIPLGSAETEPVNMQADSDEGDESPSSLDPASTPPSIAPLPKRNGSPCEETGRQNSRRGTPTTTPATATDMTMIDCQNKRSVQFPPQPLSVIGSYDHPSPNAINTATAAATITGTTPDTDGRRRFNSAAATGLVPRNPMLLSGRMSQRALSSTIAYLQSGGKDQDTSYFFRALDFLSAAEGTMTDREVEEQKRLNLTGLQRQPATGLAVSSPNSLPNSDSSHRHNRLRKYSAHSAHLRHLDKENEGLFSFMDNMRHTQDDGFDTPESRLRGLQLRTQRGGSLVVTNFAASALPSRGRQASMPFYSPDSSRRPTSSDLGDILTAAFLVEQHRAAVARHDGRSDSVATIVTTGPGYLVDFENAAPSSAALLNNSNQSSWTPSQELAEFINRALARGQIDGKYGETSHAASRTSNHPVSADTLHLAVNAGGIEKNEDASFRPPSTLENAETPTASRRASDNLYAVGRYDVALTMGLTPQAETSPSSRPVWPGTSNASDNRQGSDDRSQTPTAGALTVRGTGYSMAASIASTAEPFMADCRFPTDTRRSELGIVQVQEATLARGLYPSNVVSAPGSLHEGVHEDSNPPEGDDVPVSTGVVKMGFVAATSGSSGNVIWVNAGTGPPYPGDQPLGALPRDPLGNLQDLQKNSTHFSGPFIDHLAGPPPGETYVDAPALVNASFGLTADCGECSPTVAVAMARDSVAAPAIPLDTSENPQTCELSRGFAGGLLRGLPPRQALSTRMSLDGTQPHRQTAPIGMHWTVMGETGNSSRWPDLPYFPIHRCLAPEVNTPQTPDHLHRIQAYPQLIPRSHEGKGIFGSLQSNHAMYHEAPLRMSQLAQHYYNMQPVGGRFQPAEGYADDHDRMVFISWIPKQSRAYNSNEKRRDELEFKAHLRENLKIQGVAKVLLFPPKGAHCKVIFQTRAHAEVFMERYGGDNGSPNTERWKADVCAALRIQLTEKFDQTVIKIEWAQR